MRPILLALLALLLSHAASAAPPIYAVQGTCDGHPGVALQVPAGWCAGLVADARDGLRMPRRLLAVAPHRFWIVDMGNWEPRRGRLLELRTDLPHGAAGRLRVLASGLDRPHGLALCNALQVINHLQDCAKDHAALDRVYLPEDWMRAAGASADDLRKDAATPGLRGVLDRCLDGTERLMTEARRLPKAMRHKSLAAETAVIVSVADRLVAKLRRRDPIAGRVALGPFGFAAAAISGLAGLWLP